jgi:hypothetical protein
MSTQFLLKGSIRMMKTQRAPLDEQGALDHLKARLYGIHPAHFQNSAYLRVWCPPRVAELLYQEGHELQPTRIEHTPGFPPLHCLSNALQVHLQDPADRVPYFGFGLYGNHIVDPLSLTVWWPHCFCMAASDGTLFDTAELSPTPRYFAVPFGSALFRAVEAKPAHPIYDYLETRLGLWHLCR